MEPQNEKPANQKPTPNAAEHVAGAHRLMKTLQDRIGKHPELEQAIYNLEMALNALTIKTGGML
jgi:hypothetical protein